MAAQRAPRGAARKEDSDVRHEQLPRPHRPAGPRAHRPAGSAHGRGPRDHAAEAAGRHPPGARRRPRARSQRGLGQRRGRARPARLLRGPGPARDPGPLAAAAGGLHRPRRGRSRHHGPAHRHPGRPPFLQRPGPGPAAGRRGSGAAGTALPGQLHRDPGRHRDRPRRAGAAAHREHHRRQPERSLPAAGRTSGGDPGRGGAAHRPLPGRPPGGEPRRTCVRVFSHPVALQQCERFLAAPGRLHRREPLRHGPRRRSGGRRRLAATRLPSARRPAPGAWGCASSSGTSPTAAATPPASCWWGGAPCRRTTGGPAAPR